MGGLTLQHIKLTDHGFKVIHTLVRRDGDVYALFERRIPPNVKSLTINCYKQPVVGWLKEDNLRSS